ncbi:RHS repeat-associated core domain-containing protein [Vibrio vulnificus]|uniref:RHS repeat-associated core domain-containing protein n=2 Tax=Vibrio vulnificus TaxID=672 RepID=UPI00107CCE41|nr:RHS repeat-associated core domain-containing protein [Vibrio vulnificus]QBH29360.1 Rhs family protein [Vibrio vulnificus]
MNGQRIVKISAYDGSLHYFSDQPIAEGKTLHFSTELVAQQFVEKFKLASLEDIAEVSGWLGDNIPQSPFRDEKVFEDYVASLSAALAARRLHVVQFESVTPASLKPTILTPPPQNQASKPASDGKTESQTSDDKTCDEAQAESSKHHEKAGDPVSMVTGEEILTLCDLTLHHRLSFSRTYRSSFCPLDTGLGHGWRHCFDYQIHEVHSEKGELTGWHFCDEMGDVIAFPVVNQGAVSYQTYVGASCFHHENGYLLVTLANGTQYKFERKNETWLIKQIRTTAIDLIDLDYSSKQRLVGIRYNKQHCAELQYDRRGHLVEVRLPDSGKVLASYQYDAQDNLTAATNQHGQTESYFYSESHLLKRRQRQSGFSHYFEWSAEGPEAKCLRNYGDDGAYDYQFHYQDETSSYRDTLGHQWSFEHNAHGKLSSKRSPEGREWRWEYDDNGRLVCAIQPSGETVCYQYNAYGQKTKERHSSGATTGYQYNALGQQTAIRYPNGSLEQRQYNILGLLTALSDSSGKRTDCRYDKFGRLIERKASDGESHQWWWNDAHQMIAHQANQTLLRYSYNQEHRLDGIAFPNGMVTAFEHDTNGHLTKTFTYSEEDYLQHEVRYRYDECGRVTHLITPAGTSTIEWGLLAQPNAIIRPDGGELAFRYDGERNLVGISRSDACDFLFTLSPDDYVTETQNFDGVTTQYHYDLAGRLSRLESCERQVVFSYDAEGNLCLVKAGATHGVSENRYQFSHGSQLRLATNQACTIQYQYSSGGQLSQQIQGQHRIGYHHNASGQLSQLLLADGSQVNYAYTTYGQLAAISMGEKQPCVHFDYDSMGRICSVYYGQEKEQKRFDGIGRLSQQQWSNRSRKYHYDTAHQLAIIIDSVQGASHYQYDSLGQLTRAKTAHQEETYRFDSFGNPSEADCLLMGDRLVEHNGWRFQYDAHGNQICAEGEGNAQYRCFNALNQLVQVDSDGVLSHFEYDALGRRSRKVTESGTTEFIWQGSQLIGEYHNGKYRWYFYLPNSHTPIMLVEDEQCYFYQCDQIGTPLALVDEHGSVVWQARYDTYGRAHIEVESVGNPLRFQGQYHDVETGLHYNLARYYDPRTGRFIQPDPIGLLGGINHYQYAPNPVMWVDPHGLCAKEDAPAIKAGVNDTQPQQPMFYAMGSGNYASAVKTASPTYQLHAIAPDAVQQVGIDYALGATEMLAAGAYNTAVDAVAGLAGLAQLAFGDLEQSSALIQSIQEKYSYVPQSRGAHQIINNVSGYVEAYADTMEGLGSATLEHTGSPLAATFVQLAPEIVMTAWGGRVAIRSVGKGVIPSSTANVAGARFNEIVSSVDGKVLGNYSILDNGPLSAGATTRLELNDSLAATFSGGRYAEIELADDLVVYRAWHPDQAKEFGAFWSLEKPAGSLQTRIDSALLPEWGKLKNNPVQRQQATQYTEAVIPKGTKIFIGEVGSQGSPWVGSGSQLLIRDSAVLPDWKVGGGYLQ